MKLFFNGSITIFLTGAGIGGLLTYLSTRIGRKGMEGQVNLRILQEKAKAWEEKEQRWQEEKMALIRDNERLKENLRQTEEKWRGQKEEILQIAALQKEQFQNLANDIWRINPGVLRKRTGKI